MFSRSDGPNDYENYVFGNVLTYRYQDKYISALNANDRTLKPLLQDKTINILQREFILKLFWWTWISDNDNEDENHADDIVYLCQPINSTHEYSYIWW